jgi:hypothetical protein
VSTLILAIGIISGALAAPAWAHVSVGADPAQPGVANVVEFRAAAESKTAGITKLEIVADPAIPADLVTLVEGPTGWKVGTGSSGGFALEGPTLPVGQDADVKVRVTSLPAAPQIVFKVLESYSDGKIDRWIELAGPDGKEPESPAPILKLGAGVQTAALDEGDEEHPEAAAGETLARTGSGSDMLLAVAGLLLIAGGASIAAEAGCRRHPQPRIG